MTLVGGAMDLSRFVLVAVLLGVCDALGECDPLVPDYCGLPLPNSFFTRRDPTSVTGVRVNFSTKALPEGLLGEKINPRDWNTFGKLKIHIIISSTLPGIYNYLIIGTTIYNIVLTF